MASKAPPKADCKKLPGIRDGVFDTGFGMWVEKLTYFARAEGTRTLNPKPYYPNYLSPNNC